MHCSGLQCGSDTSPAVANKDSNALQVGSPLSEHHAFKLSGVNRSQPMSEAFALSCKRQYIQLFGSLLRHCLIKSAGYEE